MKTFTDTAGRTWTLAITVDAIKRVKSLLGENLAEPERGDPPLITRLDTDFILLCDLLYVLVKPQADEQNVSDEQFGQSLGGEAIAHAREAFWDEWQAFFTSLGRRHVVAAIQKQRQLVIKSMDLVTTKLNGINLDAAVDKVIGEEMDKAISSLSMSLPESSDSTPAPSPSAS